MKTFLLVDFNNLVFRTRYSTTGDIDSQVGLTLHIFLKSLMAASEKFKVDHIVICGESKSWRSSIYADYKINRKLKNLQKTPKEQEEDKVFFESIGELWKFLEEKTNVTTLRVNHCEADDIIALWTVAHPDDRNIILSTDEDFVQLIKDGVEQYDGVKEMHVTKDGYYDKNGNPMTLKDGSTKPDPEYHLFLKCIRGDSDNIFPSYPKVRVKSSKNKIGILEAYNDRHDKGFAYNNFFNQTWEDHNGETVVVKDRFEFNRKLMDLTMQPDYVKVECLEAIMRETEKPRVDQVGIHLMKFCGIWELNNIAKDAQYVATHLNKRY